MENQQNLIEQFISAAERAAATVERVHNSPAALSQAISKITAGEKTVLLAEPDYLPDELFRSLRELPGIITHPTEEQMATTKIGITDAFAGVAGTGSICVALSRNLGGSISLYTREHVAVLSAQSIVSRPRDIFTMQAKGGNHQDFVFITGPSATADMGPLVRGVHGPGKLHIILLEETDV